MGDAPDIICVRRRYADQWIAPHRAFNLHVEVNAWCVHVAAVAGRIDSSGCLHSRT